MRTQKRNKRVEADSKFQRYTLITLAITALILICISIAIGENDLKTYQSPESIDEMREYHENRIQEMYPNENVTIILFE